MDKVGTIINSGRYGTVKKFFHPKMNKLISIKTLPKRRDDVCDYKNKEMISRERTAWTELNKQPNILELYNILEDDQNVYFISELCKDKNLQELDIYKYEDREKNKIIKQILNGIYQCHSKNYSHGDIKLGNTLINYDNIIKICDFGNSLISSQEDGGLYGARGTPFYAAPEILSKYNSYGRNVDMWALGIIVFQFYHYNLHPYYKKDICHNLYIDNNKIDWDYSLDKNIKDFILKCLSYDKYHRISSSEALEHPFIKNINF